MRFRNAVFGRHDYLARRFLFWWCYGVTLLWAGYPLVVLGSEKYVGINRTLLLFVSFWVALSKGLFFSFSVRNSRAAVGPCCVIIYFFGSAFLLRDWFF